MTDKEFVKLYRAKNNPITGRERPPCLNCSDETIVQCSHLHPGKNVGCIRFKNYIKA